MTLADLIKNIHAYIREEFIAVSRVDGNEITVQFVGGRTIEISFAENMR